MESSENLNYVLNNLSDIELIEEGTEGRVFAVSKTKGRMYLGGIQKLHESGLFEKALNQKWTGEIRVLNEGKVKSVKIKDGLRISQEDTDLKPFEDEFVESESFFIVGEIKIPIRDKAKMSEKEIALIPALDEKFKPDLTMLRDIAMGIAMKQPVMAIGPTGCGKSSIIMWLAAKTNNPVYNPNCDDGLERQDLIACPMLDVDENGNGRTIVREQMLTEAVRKGYWFVLEEVNAARPGVKLILNGLFDDTGKLTVQELNEQIVPHENFRMFMTSNPPNDPMYAGITSENAAFKNRCLVLWMNYTSNEEAILVDKAGVKASEARKMVKVAEDLRQGARMGEIMAVLSTRQLINWGQYAQMIGMEAGFERAVLNQIDERDEAVKALKLYEITFGKSNAIKIHGVIERG